LEPGDPDDPEFDPEFEPEPFAGDPELEVGADPAVVEVAPFAVVSAPFVLVAGDPELEVGTDPASVDVAPFAVVSAPFVLVALAEELTAGALVLAPAADVVAAPPVTVTGEPTGVPVWVGLSPV